MLARYYRKKGFIVACQDEATFGLIPNIVRGWAKIGSRPTRVHNFQHKYINVFGARSKKAFVFSFTKRKRQRQFVAFLGKLSRRWHKVCLFTDNAPWHRGNRVDAFLKTHQKTFRLHKFPKYCPDLNPVEPCWKPARKTVGNRFVPSIDALEDQLKIVFSDPFLMPRMFKCISD